MQPLLAALTGYPEIAVFFEPAAEITALLQVEAALAKAQSELGILDSVTAGKIVEASRTIAIDELVLRQGLVHDGVVVPELVRQLRAAAGDAGLRVHLGSTSQDIIDTGLMLRLRGVLSCLLSRLDEILTILGKLSQDQGRQPLMAQTRMQAALPFTVADKINTWMRPLKNHRERLRNLQAELPIQLGGPIGNGASFGPSYERLRAAMAKELKLRDTSPWHSDRTPVLDVAYGFAVLTGTLAKIGQDVVLMAQSEVRVISLAGGGSSSAMAHKQNPIGAEVLISLGRFNAGLMGTLSQSMIHENERSGAAWTLEWLILPQMAESGGRACALTSALLSSARFTSSETSLAGN